VRLPSILNVVGRPLSLEDVIRSTARPPFLRSALESESRWAMAVPEPEWGFAALAWGGPAIYCDMS
jgi:hypothetical protein